MASTNPQVSAIGDLAVENAVDKYKALANLEGSRGSAARNALVTQGNEQAKALYNSEEYKKLESGKELTEEDIDFLKNYGVDVDNFITQTRIRLPNPYNTSREEAYNYYKYEENPRYAETNTLNKEKLDEYIKYSLNPLATIQKYTSPSDVIQSLDDWQASQSNL